MNGARILGGFVALAVTAAIGGLSRYEWAAHRTDSALVSLGWRTRSPRVQECRVPTEEELAGLPVHMRQREICEGRVLAYYLTLDIDGLRVLDDTVHGAGAREDRPLFVFHEFEVSPGSHAIDVSFSREDHADVTDENQSLTPAMLGISDTVNLETGQIARIWYDAEARELKLGS